jgi:hypothetical protein
MSFWSSILDFFAGLFGKKPAPPPPVSFPDWTISNGVVQMRASRRFGSAIYSIIWNGVEAIDSYDHGRLYQSAWQYDGLGEGYNPTEGGSAADAIGGTSSSAVVTAMATNNTLTVTSRPALWQPHAGDTGSQLEKTVRVGAGHPNLISDVRVITADGDHGDTAIEVLTAYLTPRFTNAKSFNVHTGVYTEFALPTNGAASTPDTNAIVAYAPDGSCAFGLWSPDPSVIMLGQRVQGITKLDIWTDMASIKAGERHGYICYAAIGSLEDVAAALQTASGTILS